ncbi:MAG: hypothetical protein CMH50_02080 [Myxococcales bacterium]|nr:hypothetical protein [Myxococcales bacterium]
MRLCIGLIPFCLLACPAPPVPVDGGSQFFDVGSADTTVPFDASHADVAQRPADAGFVADAGPTREAQFPPSFGPVWTQRGQFGALSSLRNHDLDGDGVQDLILGSGHEMANAGHVTALSGRDGEVLWSHETTQDIFGSALIADLGPRPGLEVVIGGRDAELYALDAQTGELLWKFEPFGSAGREADWFNWLALYPIGDLDGDGWQELLTANGGDRTRQEFEARDPGQIVVISSRTGAVLLRALTPDRAETYMSPVLYEDQGRQMLLFGTGGETHRGSLWRISLDLLLETESLESAQELVEPTTHKGVIAPPSLVDLTGDGRLDIVVAAFDGRLLALDGVSNDIIWSHHLDDCETQVTPAIGYFNDDDIPDVFAGFSVGTWPLWSDGKVLAVSGSDGSILYQEDFDQYWGVSSPLAVDLDGDDRHEVIFQMNQIISGQVTRILGAIHSVVDFPSGDRHELLRTDGVSYGTARVVDLDNDGWLEIAFTHAIGGRWTLEVRQLDTPVPQLPSWGEYMGPGGRGIFQTRRRP